MIVCYVDERQRTMISVLGYFVSDDKYLYYYKCIKMELSHSLTLNEDALKEIPEPKRPVFIFEWLRFLDKVLVAAQEVCRLLLSNRFFDILQKINIYTSTRKTRNLVHERKN